MSVKHFCDVCAVELNDKDHGRLQRKLGRVSIEVIHTLDKTSNAGEVCHKCILLTINNGSSD